MQPKSLQGVMPKGKAQFLDSKGQDYRLQEIVFPIFKQDENGVVNLIGTGFFIANQGIFLTAKHVLMDVFDNKDNQIQHIFLVQLLDNGSYVSRPIVRCVSHDKADISVGLAASMNSNTKGDLKNRYIPLSFKTPNLGQIVFTYAYPQTQIEALDSEFSQKIHLYPDFFEGKINALHLHGRDTVMMPGACLETDMFIHGGASGGPVFNLNGGVLGVNSTGFDGNDISYITPVHVIENLLFDGVSIEGITSDQTRIRQLVESGHIKVV